jgi:hypothetical protein
MNSLVENCSAVTQGGFYTYAKFRPVFINNTYKNNRAEYGNNIASFAIKIHMNDSNPQTIALKDVAPG